MKLRTFWSAGGGGGAGGGPLDPPLIFMVKVRATETKMP